MRTPPPTYAETMQQITTETTTESRSYATAAPFSYPANPVGTEIPSSSLPQDANQPVNVTLVQATTPLFGPHPVATDCFYCHEHVVTSTEYTPGVLPWVIALILFFVGFLLIIPWCLCCIPFCVDGCLDVVHKCPNCKRELSKYRRI
uniref:LITAF domain-containing protein n=1 Tax=Syphacia muris TaxID=451379 RepID=A0A0N5AP99_9BILA